MKFYQISEKMDNIRLPSICHILQTHKSILRVFAPSMHPTPTMIPNQQWYFPALICAKFSVAAVVQNLTPDIFDCRTIIGLKIFMIVWSLASMLAAAFHVEYLRCGSFSADITLIRYMRRSNLEEMITI